MHVPIVHYRVCGWDWRSATSRTSASPLRPVRAWTTARMRPVLDFRYRCSVAQVAMRGSEVEEDASSFVPLRIVGHVPARGKE